MLWYCVCSRVCVRIRARVPARSLRTHARAPTHTPILIGRGEIKAMARGLVGSESTFVMKNPENGVTYEVFLHAM